MSTAVAVRIPDNAIALVENIAAECSLQAIGQAGQFMRAFKMAEGMKMLREAITGDMMRSIVELQGSSLGFKTDKDKSTDGSKYSVAEIKECLIEAVLRGAYPVGNEFNIIAGRAYMTKEYFTRKVREFPGLTDLRLYPGVPVMVGSEGALVPFSVTWNLGGKPMRIDRTLTTLADKTQLDERICVKVNRGMGADAVIGKATRKILAAVYAQLTGSDFSDGDATEGPDQIQRTPVRTLDALTERITTPAATNGNGNGNGHAETKDEAPSAADAAAAQAEFTAILSKMDAAKEINEVNTLKRRANEIAQTDEDSFVVAQAAEQAIERIKAGRGERSTVAS